MRSGVNRIALMMLLVLAVSCSASRQNGFSYRPSYQGPDVSGSVETSSTREETIPAQVVPTPAPQSVGLAEEGHVMASDLARIVDQQMENNTVGKVDARKAVRDIAEAYTVEKNITLTAKQQRKLDKYAAKLEKKQQQKADVEWGPKNNLEIFLLAAAGVGLVVGFFSAIGWFVFLVAALVYLYLKLLKD